MISLGPRIIQYGDSKGGKGEIKIVAELLGSVDKPLGGGELYTDFQGRITMSCALFEKTMNLTGNDDLHLIMLCLWFSDLWLQRVCRNNHIAIYRVRPGDIDEDLAVYRP